LDANDIGAQLKEVLIPADRVRERIVELAAQIDTDYAGRELLLVGVLKGAVMVMADLARAMRLPVRMDVEVAYTGFDIGNEFVIGYGLDYAERYRNLTFIGTLAPHVYGGDAAGTGSGEHDQR